VPEPKAPSFSIPKTSELNLHVPKVSIPKTPEVPKIPSRPPYSLETSKNVYDFNSSPVAPKVNPANYYEPQEIRDMRARDARVSFAKAQNELKALDEKARTQRQIVNEKSKQAKEAKDLACETRTGGKILCVRPFSIGY